MLAQMQLHVYLLLHVLYIVLLLIIVVINVFLFVLLILITICKMVYVCLIAHLERMLTQQQDLEFVHLYAHKDYMVIQFQEDVY